MNKFVACLVHESDKSAIVALRDSIGLNEKDTMALLVKFALQHEEQIKAIAAEQVKIEKESREERRKAAYELLKQKMKEARDEIKLQKVQLKISKTEVSA